MLEVLTAGCIFLMFCVTCLSQNLTASQKMDFDGLVRFREAMNNITANSFCELSEVGQTFGAHMLCNYAVHNNHPCHYISFGVSYDYSFETDLHNRHNCTGISLDPTVDHPMKITPGAIFLKSGANMLNETAAKGALPRCGLGSATICMH